MTANNRILWYTHDQEFVVPPLPVGKTRLCTHFEMYRCSCQVQISTISTSGLHNSSHMMQQVLHTHVQRFSDCKSTLCAYMALLHCLSDTCCLSRSNRTMLHVIKLISTVTCNLRNNLPQCTNNSHVCHHGRGSCQHIMYGS